HLGDAELGNPYTFTVLPDGTRFWGTSGAQVRVNPNFADVDYRKFRLISDYNSMQLRVTKRFSSGLQVQSSYTLSRNLDDGSEVQQTALMDATNPLLDYGLSALDVRHNWTANFIYQLPYLGKDNGALKAILGGWQVSGLVTAQTGNPRNIVEGFNRSRDGNVLSGSANNDRPNLKSGADANPIVGDGRDPTKYADVSSFELQPAGVHGNLGRNTLIGPGILQFDTSFVKNVPFGRDRRVELRAEFFNLFNRANFGNPTVTAFT